MNRKHFLKTSLAVGGAAIAAPYALNSQDKQGIFDAEEIREFVFAAHKSLEDTRKIIEAKPLLLNCTNQNKKGDFETAVGGASHMGRKDIADLLVSKGARLDIFSYTFLGYTDFVKQLIIQQPNLLYAPGPHGFNLLHHAEAGKHEEFADWLKSKGLKETFFKGAFG